MKVRFNVIQSWELWVRIILIRDDWATLSSVQRVWVRIIENVIGVGGINEGAKMRKCEGVI